MSFNKLPSDRLDKGLRVGIRAAKSSDIERDGTWHFEIRDKVLGIHIGFVFTRYNFHEDKVFYDLLDEDNNIHSAAVFLMAGWVAQPEEITYRYILSLLEQFFVDLGLVETGYTVDCCHHENNHFHCPLGLESCDSCTNPCNQCYPFGIQPV
jgi:hypothetical protein